MSLLPQYHKVPSYEEHESAPLVHNPNGEASSDPADDATAAISTSTYPPPAPDTALATVETSVSSALPHLPDSLCTFICGKDIAIAHRDATRQAAAKRLVSVFPTLKDVPYTNIRFDVSIAPAPPYQFNRWARISDDEAWHALVVGVKPVEIRVSRIYTAAETRKCRLWVLAAAIMVPLTVVGMAFLLAYLTSDGFRH